MPTALGYAELAPATQPDERRVFIDAWNEWGEGCYLEPDAQYSGYPNATHQVLIAHYARVAANVRAAIVDCSRPSYSMALLDPSAGTANGIFE